MRKVSDKELAIKIIWLIVFLVLIGCAVFVLLF